MTLKNVLGRKKIIKMISFCSLALVATLAIQISFCDSNETLYVNAVDKTGNNAPFTQNDQTYVPIDIVTTAMGDSATLDSTKTTASISLKDGTKININKNSSFIDVNNKKQAIITKTINGITVPVDVKPVQKDSNMYVPVSVVSDIEKYPVTIKTEGGKNNIYVGSLPVVQPQTAAMTNNNSNSSSGSSKSVQSSSKSSAKSNGSSKSSGSTNGDATTKASGNTGGSDSVTNKTSGGNSDGGSTATGGGSSSYEHKDPSQATATLSSELGLPIIGDNGIAYNSSTYGWLFTLSCGSNPVQLILNAWDYGVPDKVQTICGYYFGANGGDAYGAISNFCSSQNHKYSSVIGGRTLTMTQNANCSQVIVYWSN